MRRAVLTTACVGVIVAGFSTAHADEADFDVKTVIPTFDVEADLDGRGQAELGLQLRWNAALGHHVALSLGAEVGTADGETFSDLDGVGDVKRFSWQAGFTVSYFNWGLSERVSTDRDGALWERALATCLARCELPNPAESSAAFCKDYQFLKGESGRRVRASEISDWCVDPAVDAARAGDPTSSQDYVRFPRLTLNLGVKVGTRFFEWIDAVDSAAPPAPERELTRQDDHLLTLTSGVSVVVVSRELGNRAFPATFEASGLWRRTATASSTAVRTCRASLGTVDLGEDGETAPASVQECDDAIFGGPTAANEFDLGFFAGGYDRVKGRWRMSAGVRMAGNPDAMRLAFEVPFYVGLAEMDAGDEGRDLYSVLLRVAPVVEYGGIGTDDPAWSATVVFGILGQRTLFSESFDTL